MTPGKTKHPAHDSKSIELLPYRPCVGMMILNRENKVFVAQRTDTKVQSWQMPQGGIDVGETPSKAAFREMKEEIGTNNAIILLESHNWYSYDIPGFMISRLWNGKYRGQKQKWFLMRFMGEDCEINIKTSVPEFSRWQWVEIEDLVDIIVPFKRKLYSAIVSEFRPFLKG
ncbi:MAG: RNA pyrophosphohydrolase [Alphaproteobacteria bacterium]|nr:RNA pyrophosphohydrolase [Alphaproteobacteria bacterium]